MVIKETALQLEDAVLRPPCWQASVREQSEPRPLEGGLPLCHLGRIFPSRSHETLGRRARTLKCRSGVVLQQFWHALYFGKINFWLHFFLNTFICLSPTALLIHSSHTDKYEKHMKKWHQQNSLLHDIWWPKQPELR